MRLTGLRLMLLAMLGSVEPVKAGLRVTPAGPLTLGAPTRAKSPLNWKVSLRM